MGNPFGRSMGLGVAILWAVLLGLAGPAAANSNWAWGDNESGDLGDNSVYEKRVPDPVQVLPGNIVGLGAGAAHSLAFDINGNGWAWGDNESGQVGDNTSTDRSVPVRVSGLLGIVDASGGYLHSLARKNDGSVWAWGDNSYGQLGDNTLTDRLKPVQVQNLTTTSSVAMAIAAGDFHSIALLGVGSVWAWGHNDHGQLGNNNTGTDSSQPVQAKGLAGVVAIAAGAAHSLAVRSDGTVWAWGDNSSGELGNNSTTDSPVPVQVHNLTNVVAVAAGGNHSLALRGDGTVWAWGENPWGQLGDSTATDRHEPVQVHNLTGVVAIAAGDWHSLALRDDGSICAWGHNGYGQLGDNTAFNRLEPVVVTSLSTTSGTTTTPIPALVIAAGGNHSLAVTGAGLPDLRGYGCNGPRTAYWNQAINVACQIANSGSLGAGAFHVQWYLSQNPVGSATGDIPLNRTSGATYWGHNGIAASSLGPQFTVALQLPAALPSGWSGTRFYVIMQTDSLNVVAESNENNNFGELGDGVDRFPITILTAVPQVVYPTLPDEVWVPGQSHTITWKGFVSSGVKIELYKAGVLNHTINSAIASSTGFFAWTVPGSQTLGADYAIKVTATSDASITASSANPLTIANPKVTYPTAANLAWLGGKLYTITWSGFPDATVNVDLYKGGALLQHIVAGTPNTPSAGSYGWTVPLGQTVGTGYTVVVSSPTNPQLTATSPQPITIAVPQVTYPTAAGVTWVGGTAKTITWTGFSGANVRIDLYKGTALSHTISASAVNTGSFTWTVPTTQAAGSTYTIKVTSTTTTTPVVFAASANAFTITP